MNSATSQIDSRLRGILADVLGLSPERTNALQQDSGLFGHLPELDSMAVANLLAEMEDRLGIAIEDAEIDGELLDSFGSLLAFVQAKLADGTA